LGRYVGRPRTRRTGPRAPLPIASCRRARLSETPGAALLPCVPGDSGPRSHERAIRRSEEHTSELQSRFDLVCRLLLEKKKTNAMCKTPTMIHKEIHNIAVTHFLHSHV